MERRLFAVDVAVAVVAFAISAAVLAAADPVSAGEREPDPAAYVLAAVYSGSLLLRRRMPVVAVCGGLGLAVVFSAAEYPPALTPVALLSVYSAAALLPRRRAAVVLAAAVVLGWLWTTLSPGPTDLGLPAVTVAAWLLGLYVGSRRAATAELERKNRELEQAQLDLAARAVVEERLRIARELHDVIAHTLSVVAVHAGTGRMVAEDDPAAARRALATIESATRSALREMRRMLGVLRGNDDSRPEGLAPAPGLTAVDTLVADVVDSGLPVELRIEGDRGHVPAGVDQAAYRIAQEALTNAIRHSGGAPVTVTVRYADDAVNVEVDDEGSGARAHRTEPAAGHGLAGMRERVALYHGDFAAGPGPQGGFRVAARLPFGERS